jgi:hypothetical protein
MNVSITDEIIDAMIQNEQRLSGRPRKPIPIPVTWAPQGSRNLSVLKPDWTQLPPQAN